MAPHAVLRELEAPFELARVDISNAENRTPAHLAINPNARVPTVIDGERSLYEAAAIVLYPCEKHPQGGLMPLPGEAGREHFLQWLFYLTNTMQEELQHWRHAGNYLDHKASRADMKSVAERRLGVIFSRFVSML